MARPRIKDVARHAGVSEKTVSNVINDYAHVSDRTRQVVREAIEHLGYRVNLAGRHLRKGRTGIIALVVPELDIPYFAELARHVIREAEERSLTVLIHQSGADRDHELAALAGFGSTFVDGIILSPLALTATTCGTVRASRPRCCSGSCWRRAPTMWPSTTSAPHARRPAI